MKLFVLLLAVSCLVHSVVGYGSGISSTVLSLSNYQADNGGFTTQIMDGASGNLEDTAHALFLGSLFGVKEKLNVDNTLAFLQTLQNSDHGYANQAGQTSDLESLRNALLAYIHLGTLPADQSGLVSFVNSLYDSNAKLYRNAAGSTPDYKATARALQIFELLGFKSDEVEAKKKQIAEQLTAALKTEEGKSYFSTITSDNYFAIFVGDLTGFEFADPQNFISFFQSRQVPSGARKGGFFSDDYATDVDVSDAEYAVHAIYILSNKAPVARTSVNIVALNGFLNSLPPSLSNAAHAYGALAKTTSFQEGFKLTPTYAVTDNQFKVVGNRIVQGTVFRTSLFFRTSYGQAHAGAEADVTISHPKKTERKVFTYNPTTQTYESEEYFDTTNLFGEVTLTFNLKWAVPGFDEISFTFTEKKSVGFDISVKSVAAFDGDEMDPTETVQVGTTFTFALGLGTVSVPKPSLVKGDFEVTFSVVDSSEVAIHTKTLDASANSGSLSFTYELAEANVPAGRLTFRFEVSNENGVHTVEQLWYNLKAAMVATEIDFDEDQVLNFGQKLSVTMTPASLADGTVSTYTKGTRRFFLDVFSAKSHTLLASFPGQSRPSGESFEYVFDLTVPSRFDFIGTNVIAFRYQDALGNDFVLQNYDSDESELFQEELKYTVEASLEITDETGAPHAGELEYGAKINFSFKVKDTWSETVVQRGTADASVFLALQHVDKNGKTFTSSKVRANPDKDETGQYNLFTVDWEVDPNAVKGEAKLVLFAQDADGNTIPLQYEGEDWVVDVTVTGSLKIEEQTYSHVYDDFDTAFFVTFQLKTNDQALSGAQFTAKVTRGGAVVAVAPVAASADGEYQLSWFLESNKAHSGDYVVDVYRKVDLELSGSENPLADAKPFFSLTHRHEGRSATLLPFKTDFLVLLLLGVTLVTVSVQKLELEKKN